MNMWEQSCDTHLCATNTRKFGVEFGFQIDLHACFLRELNRNEQYFLIYEKAGE